MINEHKESQKVLSKRDKHSRNLSEITPSSSTLKAISTYAPNSLLPLYPDIARNSG